MYRFLLAPRWIGFHLIVVIGVVTMINLGLWQLNRLDQRQEFNAAVSARYDAPVTPIVDLFDTTPDSLADYEWRPVSLTGTYLPEHAVLIANRSQNGRAGQNVAVPVRLDDQRIVMINRGFVPLAEPIPPLPGTSVEIVGRLRQSEERGFGQLTDPADGDLSVLQRLDIERLAPQLPGPVLPLYVELVESIPAESGPFPEPVATPNLGEGNHLSYAVQWFIFSIAVAAGWVLAVRRSIGTHRHRATRSALTATPTSAPQPTR